MLCPLQFWDEFFLQVELTLNMLHFSQKNPKESANQEVYGSFDFNKTPLAPLGTKALVYNDPGSQTSWAPHATNGFYTGHASDHYQCVQFYIPATSRFSFSNTWHLYPAHCQVPVALQHDLSIAAAADLLKVFGGTVPTLTAEKNLAHPSHPGTHHDHGRTANNPTSSGCTNSKGGCTMSEGGNYSTTKGGY
jgi:hypothetical protein